MHLSLVNYDSSSSESDDEAVHSAASPNLSKRRTESPGSDSVSLDAKLTSAISKKRPVSVDDVGENGSLQAEHSVQAKLPDELTDLVSRIIKRCEEVEPDIKPIELFEDGTVHLSLSRTIYLKVFHINRFVEMMEARFKNRTRFPLSFTKLQRYVNDDGTRSFLSLDVGTGVNELTDCLKDVDAVISEWNQRTFYEDPKFHISIAWALGSAGVSTSLLELVQAEFDPALLSLCADPTNLIAVMNISCRIGNRLYKWNLS
ncbi:poly(U)-specific 3'-to-5' RNA exonuclease [Quaeritorhiza haematococci]|nr:poly(U)-specific 3'-to-5' RNA exonuclease [Quaeritorhiza haematococci]